jgi:hypothetical protein
MGMDQKTFPDTLNDHNDAVAMTLATRTLAGEVTESRARWEIASLLVNSGLIDQAARHHISKRGSYVNRQSADDVATILRAVLVTKVAGHNPALDLKTISQGSSLSGWARRFATSFEMGATVNRTLDHLPSPVEQETLDHIANRVKGLGYVESTPDEDQARSTAEDIADRFRAAAYNVVQEDLPVLQATALATYYEVPLPVRGVRLTGYLKLRRRLEAGGEHTVSNDIGETLESPGTGPVGLAVLWGPTADVPLLTRLYELPPIVLQSFATHSLTPISPPPVEDVKTLIKDAHDAMGTTSSLRLVTKLVKTWLDTYAELNARHRNHFATRPRLVTKAEYHANQRAWTDLATRFLGQGPFTALGSTPDAIAEWLEQDLTRIRLRLQ